MRRKKGNTAFVLAVVFALAAVPGDTLAGRGKRFSSRRAALREETEALRSPNPGRRVRAALRLGEMGERAAPAATALIEVLGDGRSVTLRDGGKTTPGQAAAEALVEIGDPAAAPLASALRDPGMAGRRRAEWALARIRGTPEPHGAPGTVFPPPQRSVPAGGDDGGGTAARFGVGGSLYPPVGRGEERIYKTTGELERLGSAWLRHPGRGISWHEIQPTRDSWDFRKLDAVLKDNPNPWIFFIYGAVGSVYPFGSDFSKSRMKAMIGKRDVIRYIRSHTVDVNDPAQRRDAERYVKTLVGRYGERVKHWEVRNEGINAADAAALSAATYGWIKAAAPSAKVLAIAIAGDDEKTFAGGMRAFEKMLAGGAGNCFDIGNFHYYGKTGGDLEERCERRFDEYRGLMDRYGVRKPIWVTETATSSASDPRLSGKSSEAAQARDLVRRLVVFAAKGAEKVVWFNYRKSAPGDKFYGCNLVNEKTGVPKPAYHTFRLLLDKIGRYGTAETLRRDGVRVYRFVNPGKGPVIVAWSGPGGATVNLRRRLGAGEAKVTHIVEGGVSVPETETADASRVRLSPSPVFVEPATTP